jgi:hypothetical protein
MQFDALEHPAAMYSEEFRSEHLEEGMDPDWAIELRDKSMQFLLTESRAIETVFVLSEEAHLAELGSKGAWLRYDHPKQVIHLEFRPGGRGILMVTLMAPEHAP